MFLIAALLSASISASEEAKIFRAAGFTRRGNAWKTGYCDGFESNSYAPGRIAIYRDLNDDGRPEAIVTEGGAICYGNTGVHFWILSRQTGGTWKRVVDGLALPEILPSKGVGGWPDIFMGGPGLCRRVVRWNGKTYETNRFQGYDGKPCKLR